MKKYYFILGLFFLLMTSCQNGGDYRENAPFAIRESSSKTSKSGQQKERSNNSDLSKLIAKEVVSYHDFYDENGSNPIFTEQDINNRVYKWIKYFTEENRGWFARSLERSYQYETRMKSILKQSNVPTDLFYLAMIESGFVKKARSHAGAQGIWQFIKGTAKMYGLRVSRWRDERHSPYKATAAAAAYLKDLHNIYGSWHLALASYNAGEFRVRRAILKNGERNFWKLIDKGALPSETANYVPKFIAAAIIAKSPEKFDFNVPANRRQKLYVQNNTDYDTVLNKLGQYKRRNVSKNNRVYSRRQRQKARFYRVRRGDNLWQIAKRHGTTVTSIKLCSKLRGTSIRPKQQLTLRCSRKSRIIANSKNTKIYVVRQGDTLWGISRKFSTSISKIKNCNPRARRRSIFPGQRLKMKCST